MMKIPNFQGGWGFVVFGYVKARSIQRARTNQTSTNIMKTKLTLFLAAVAFTGMSYAGPSESANYAIRHAQELANRANAPMVAAASDTSSYRITTAPSGKGVIRVPNNDAGATNIALFKSSKKGSCASAACCAKKQ